MSAMKIVRNALLAFGLLALPAAVYASPVTYVLGTPGVV